MVVVDGSVEVNGMVVVVLACVECVDEGEVDEGGEHAANPAPMIRIEADQPLQRCRYG